MPTPSTAHHAWRIDASQRTRNRRDNVERDEGDVEAIGHRHVRRAIDCGQRPVGVHNVTFLATVLRLVSRPVQ